MCWLYFEFCFYFYFLLHTFFFSATQLHENISAGNLTRRSACAVCWASGDSDASCTNECRRAVHLRGSDGIDSSVSNDWRLENEKDDGNKEF